MPGDSDKASSDFLTVASSLGILSAESVQRLVADAKLRDMSVEHLALQQGLLSAIQLDMVQTLRNPLSVVPGYEIQGVLGQGGMGVVYRARQTTLQRPVALKTILLSLMTDANAIARFQQEAVAVARLRHPNIITAFDFGQHAGRLYFVIELVEGEDLNNLIARNGPMDEPTAWGLARQVVAGLAHAAHEGIVHRDIKPANLLLVAPPTGFSLPSGLSMVKIADFGLASLGAEEEVLTRLTAVNTMLGSPHYMAPEQLTNSNVDLRADIYALGITIYHMLTGSPPFSGPVTQILSQKLRGNIPTVRTQRPDVSFATAELVAAMTQTEPENRPANYAELLESIDQLLHETGAAVADSRSFTKASTVTRQSPPREAAKEKPTVVDNASSGVRAWSITAAVACAILITGFLIANHQQKSIPQSVPKYISTGWREFLFHGTLKDWLSVSGQWGDVVDDDGAKVLAGSGGSVRRELSRLAEGERQPLKNYRVTMSICLHEASAVEVQFGIKNAELLDTRRSVCRIQRDGRVWLALRTADSSALPPPANASHWTVESDRYYTVILERLDQLWRVSFDGRQVGVLPAADLPHRSEFRLAVDAGPAWFSDLEVEELAADR